MTTGLAVLRLRLDIIRCNTPPFLLTLFYLGQNMSERNNILNILSSHGGATCGCACCRMCYRNSVLGIWFSDSSFVFFFSLYPSVSAPASYSLSDSFGLKLQLWSDLSSARRSALDIFDIVSDLYSVSVSSGLDAVVYNDTQPSLLTPFISVCVPSLLSLLLYSERFFVKLNKSGLPKSPEKTERQCTLFVVSREQDFAFTNIDWEQLKAV